MFFESGETQKLLIYAYDDSTYSDDRKVAEFKVQVNPENIHRKVSIDYAHQDHPGEGQQAAYYKTNPEDFTIDILLDATGVVKDAGLLNIAIANPFASLGDENDITEQVNNLKLCLYQVSEGFHRPYFVKILYGTDEPFKGVLASLDIDYKLFTPNGKPLRAVAHIALRSSTDPAEAEVARDKQSPDITHQRIFKADSQLPLMSNAIYKDVNRYIDVAKANKLLSFRKIETGTTINFPPIK